MQIWWYFTEVYELKGLCTYFCSRLGLLLPEKYESIFDVSSKGPSSGSLVNKDFVYLCLCTYCLCTYCTTYRFGKIAGTI